MNAIFSDCRKNSRPGNQGHTGHGHAAWDVSKQHKPPKRCKNQIGIVDRGKPAQLCALIGFDDQDIAADIASGRYRRRRAAAAPRRSGSPGSPSRPSRPAGAGPGAGARLPERVSGRGCARARAPRRPLQLATFPM